jgi:hypothetical protein
VLESDIDGNVMFEAHGFARDPVDDGSIRLLRPTWFCTLRRFAWFRLMLSFRVVMRGPGQVYRCRFVAWLMFLYLGLEVNDCSGPNGRS